jgi:hypothetical protein
VETQVATLTRRERSTFQVVVTGDHQARVRSRGMQYFQARFPEAACAEQRVVYAEGVHDEEGALTLMGTRRFDAPLARAFFGDPKRLQRDVLGDEVRDQLAEAKLPVLR